MNQPNASSAEFEPPHNGGGPRSPIANVQAVVGRLVSDLEGDCRAAQQRVDEAEQRRTDLQDRLERCDAIRKHVLSNLVRLRPDDIDNAYLDMSSVRAEAAAAEGVARESLGRLESNRRQLEALRFLGSSLTQVESNELAADEGAARFRSASRQVFQLIEEERMRIARDMHDGPAQSMANLVLQAEVLERLIERSPRQVVAELMDFKQSVRHVLEDTRRLIFDLRPMTLDDLGLVPTLRTFIKEFGERSDVAMRFHIVGEERRLESSIEGVLFRIIQEALANVRKHARAGVAEVTLTLQPYRVAAVVKDDGEGFDVAATEARLGKTRNLGLISMRERANLEKGSFEIRSQVGQGTEVRVAFDL